MDNNKNKNFVHFLLDVAKLGRENPTALDIFMLLCQNMDKTNALIISMKSLQEILGFSRVTISKNINYLCEIGWLCILKSGTSNVYIINPEIVWTNYANQKQYCKFTSNVIVSASENKEYLQNKKAKNFYKIIDTGYVENVKNKKIAFEKKYGIEPKQTMRRKRKNSAKRLSR